MDKSSVGGLKVPAPPEGYFWRVSSRGAWEGFVVVQLRRQAPFWLQDWLTFLGYKKELSFKSGPGRWAFSDDPAGIRYWMLDILKKRKGEPKRQKDSTYVGDYL